MGHELDKNGHNPEGNVIPVSPEQEEATRKLLEAIQKLSEQTGCTLEEALGQSADVIRSLTERQKETGAAIKDLLSPAPEASEAETNGKVHMAQALGRFELLADMSKVESIEQTAKRLGISVEAAKDKIAFARYATTPRIKKVEVTGESGDIMPYMVEFRSVQYVENRFGSYMLYHVEVNDEWGEYFILTQQQGFNRESLKTEFADKQELLIRLDSGCTCGMTFLDNSCDCSQQLHQAMQMITKKGEGMIVHIPSQDGRGMGFDGKAGTEILKHEGFDTTAAAVHYYGSTRVDKRTFSGAYAAMHAVMDMPKDLTFDVMTNSEHKLKVIEANGHEIVTTPIVVDYHPDTHKHFKSKEALGHRTDGMPLRPRKPVTN